MERAPKLGAMFSPRTPIGELPAFVERIDELGFDELWLAEDCFAHGGVAAAATVLARTRRTSVGIGLLPVGLRNAALTAMEIATLSTLYPGRVRIAFGHGVESWMRQVGARPADRVRLLREVGDVVARLTRGERVSRHGVVELDGVQLDQGPVPEPDYLVGTTGPLGLAVAGDLGFGLLLPEGSGAQAVRWARDVLPAGSDITLYSWLSIADDEHSARDTLLPVVQAWRQRGLYPRLYELAGLPGADQITAAMVPEIAIAGTPVQCARQLKLLQRAGADSVVLLPVDGDPLAALSRVASDVVPLLAD